MSDVKELLVTSAKAMRAAREEGAVVPFPSGNNYRIRNPGVAGLLKRGNLPNPLLTFTVDAFYNGVTQEKYDAFFAAKEKAEDTVAMLDSFAVVCQEMFMQPRVVEKPKTDDEVSADDIPMEDRFWAFRLCFAGVEVLHPFRFESEAAVVSVAQVENVSRKAKPNARNRGKR